MTIPENGHSSFQQMNPILNLDINKEKSINFTWLVLNSTFWKSQLKEIKCFTENHKTSCYALDDIPGDIPELKCKNVKF